MVLFTFSLVACGPKPEATVKNFFASAKNRINDPSAPKTTTDVDIKLIKGDKGWLIEANDDLQNALTGNMSKAFANNPSATQVPELKADPKVYSVNEQAKIGRAAITVIKFELSVGKDYDKPKDGYVFAVVTLNKKNTSKDKITYGANEFKMQNDKAFVI